MSEKQTPRHPVWRGNTVQASSVRIHIKPTIELTFNEETGQMEVKNMLKKSQGNTISAGCLKKKEQP